MAVRPDPVAVGKNIDAWCGRCKLDLAHVIVAMVGTRPVQVTCNTCGATHGYKPEKSAAPSAGAPRKRSDAAKALDARIERVSKAPSQSASSTFKRWNALVEEGSERARNARPYSMREAYAEGELVAHPKFGVGCVTALPGDQKVELLFRDGERVLACNRP